MNYKIFRKHGKKGQEMLIDFWAIAVFAILIVLFLVVFFATKNSVTEKLDGRYAGKDINFILTSFLRAPAVGIDSSKSVSEVLVEDYYNENYIQSNKLVKNFFDKIISHNDRTINKINICVSKNSDGFTITKNSDGTMEEDNDVNCEQENDDFHAFTKTIIPDPTGKTIEVQIEIEYYSSKCTPIYDLSGKISCKERP